MKYLSLFLILGLLAHPAFSDEKASTSDNIMIVEMNRFGFPGDWTWHLFEGPVREAFEEAGVPFQLEFHNFPVKDYKGRPALELALNFWRRTLDGRRELNFWATYVKPDGSEVEFDIITADEFLFDINTFMTDAVIRETAYKAGLKLADRLKSVL